MEEQITNKETTPRDFLSVLFKRKAVIIITFVVLTMTVFIGLELVTPAYKGEVKMQIVGTTDTFSPYYKALPPLENPFATFKDIITSSHTIERVVLALQLYNIPLDYEKMFSTKIKSILIDYRVKQVKHRLGKLSTKEQQALFFRRAVENLKRNIVIEGEKGHYVFTIGAIDFNPVGAVIIANVLSRACIITDLEQQLLELQLKYGDKHPITKQVKDKIEELKKLLDGRPIPDIEAIGPASVKIIEQARESTPLSRYNKPLLLSITMLLGIVIGILFAFGFEYLDQTVNSPKDIETFLNIPFLGSIPKRKSKDRMLVKDINPTTKYSQCYTNITNQIDLMVKDKKFKSILIIDAEFSEDTAAVIANIGLFLARKAGHKVLIIDANLRELSISKLFNISDMPGLTDVLEGKNIFENVIRDLGDNVAILPAGNTLFNPITLLDSSEMPKVIKAAKEKYEVVLIACANLRNFTDSIVLSSIVDGVILVINEGKSRQQIIKFVTAPLEQRKNVLMGAILNNRTFPIPEVIYKRI